jgi:hypothetical protein
METSGLYNMMSVGGRGNRNGERERERERAEHRFAYDSELPVFIFGGTEEIWKYSESNDTFPHPLHTRSVGCVLF